MHCGFRIMPGFVLRGRFRGVYVVVPAICFARHIHPSTQLFTRRLLATNASTSLPTMAVKRGIIYFVLSLIALALALASTATPFAHINNTQTDGQIVVNQKVTYTAWHICVDTANRNGDLSQTTTICTTNFDCTGDLVRAVRAFDILAVITLGIGCCLLGLLDGFESNYDPVSRMLLLSVGGLAGMFETISWAIQFSLWNNACSGTALKDTVGSSFGPSPILMLLAFVCTLAALAVAVVLPGIHEDSLETSASPKAARPVRAANEPTR
jgi:hypothetical protein